MAEEEKLKQAEEEKESLELDKLEISAKAAAVEKPSVTASTKSQEKPAAPPSRLTPRWQGAFALVKDRTFLLSAVASLLVGAVVLFIISSRPSPPEQVADDAIGRIVYLVSSPIGLGHYVEMTLSVPFKDTDEKRDLLKKLARVKHELPKATIRPEVTESIKKRDLDTLRGHVMKIVCDVTGVPAEKLGLEIQSLN